MHKGIILFAWEYYQIAFICELFRDSYRSHTLIIPYFVFYGVVLVAVEVAVSMTTGVIIGVLVAVVSEVRLPEEV